MVALKMRLTMWFEPSQAHRIFEFRFPIFDLGRCRFFGGISKFEPLHSLRISAAGQNWK